CPKLYGVTADDTTAAQGFATAVPFQVARQPLIVVNPTMKGHIATLTLWFGAQPKRMVVVDFSQGTTQVVDFGFRLSSNIGKGSSIGSSSNGGISQTMGSNKGVGAGLSIGTGQNNSTTGLEDDQTTDTHNQTQLHKICA
ncbi:MAG TPA: hypothetical protein VMH39_07240, partial [Gemmatimonadaceae bacterium]|nr:hypothetical protein [Gemmatimonadaceae bacterium]